MFKSRRIKPMSADEFARLCATASAEEVQAAIDDGAEWDSRAFLSAAASNNDPNVLWILLREARAAEINLLGAKSHKSGQTALHWAAGHNDNPQITRTLIAAGANVNARNNYGQTPLQEAESVHRMGWKDNRREIIDMLKRAGAR